MQLSKYAYINCLNSLLLVEKAIGIELRAKVRAEIGAWEINAKEPLLSVRAFGGLPGNLLLLKLTNG